MARLRASDVTYITAHRQSITPRKAPELTRRRIARRILPFRFCWETITNGHRANENVGVVFLFVCGWKIVALRQPIAVLSSIVPRDPRNGLVVEVDRMS